MQTLKNQRLNQSMQLNYKERLNPKLMELQFAKYRKNVQMFKKQVEQQIKTMVEDHIKEIKKLNQTIDKQRKTIQQYELKFGKLSQRDSSTFSKVLSPRKNNSYTAAEQGDKSNRILGQSNNKSKVNQSDTMKYIEGQISFLNQQLSLQSPPDQMIKSRYQVSAKLRKENQRQLYMFLKENKKNIDVNTTKVLQLVGQSPIKKLELNDNHSKKNNQNNQRIEQNYDHQLKQTKELDSSVMNSSISFICDSIDRISKSRSKSKKRKSQKPKKYKENPQAQKNAQKQKKLKNVLRNMRDKIHVKIEVQKPEQIKQSRLLSTGNGTNKNSKVMINPVPIDMTQKMHDGNRTPSPVKTQYSGILKKGSSKQHNDNRTIEGLSAISYFTRGSQASTKLLLPG